MANLLGEDDSDDEAESSMVNATNSPLRSRVRCAPFLPRHSRQTLNPFLAMASAAATMGSSFEPLASTLPFEIKRTVMCSGQSEAAAFDVLQPVGGYSTYPGAIVQHHQTNTGERGRRFERCINGTVKASAKFMA